MKSAAAAPEPEPSPTPRPMRALLLGSPAIGKTALVQSYFFDVFPGHHLPTIDQIYQTTLTHSTHPITLTVHDLGGAPRNIHLRNLWTTNISVFIVCFSVTCRDSFDEAQRLCVDTQIGEGRIVVVGLKTDLVVERVVGIEELKEWRRECARDGSVCRSEHGGVAHHAECWARKVYGYDECSALTGEGMAGVWELVVRAGLAGPLGTDVGRNECELQ